MLFVTAPLTCNRIIQRFADAPSPSSHQELFAMDGTQVRVCCLVMVVANCIVLATMPADTKRFELVTSGPLELNISTSSSLFNEIGVTSIRDCTMRCHMRGCAAISINDVSGLCQLIVLHNASSTAGPPGSHVLRLIGAEVGDRVWKVADFEQQLLGKMWSYMSNITLAFHNTGTGGSGTIQSLIVSVSGCYNIDATGAKGGSTYSGISPVYTGGNGARMSGNFSLTAGTNLSIVVGQRGSDASQGAATAGSGGGGGSFVYSSADNVLLLAAGGGGGGAKTGGQGVAGQSGPNGTDSLPAGHASRGYGGVNGQPGFTYTTNGNFHGGPGAGWLGMANMTRKGTQHGDRGGSRADGWIGGVAGSSNPGAVGGFGGGGGGACSNGASGGGGGFSGGGAGLSTGSDSFTGGGGGSFCGGSGCAGTTGGNTYSEHGFVVVKLIGPGC